MLQINAGLTHLFNVPTSIVIQLILIACITAMATASVVSGLDALQTASITVALPFTFVMLLVCWVLLESLRLEGMRQASTGLSTVTQISDATVPWEKRLAALLNHPRRQPAERFLRGTVQPALASVAGQVRERGLEAQIQGDEREAALTVFHGDEREFLYAVRLKGYPAPAFAMADTRNGAREANQYYRAEVHLLEGGQHHDVMGYTQEQVLADVISQYEKHLHFLHLVR